MIWSPVLAGPVKDVASRKIREIADIIRNKNHHTNGHGLMTGNAGEALFLYYYCFWTGNDELYDIASERFMDGVEHNTVSLTSSTSPLNLHASFYDGISGVGWEIAHLLTHQIIEGEISDTMGTVEPWLYRRMIYDTQQNRLDLLQGAAGIGLYAIRRDNRLTKEYLRRFVKELSCAVFEKQGSDSGTDYSIAKGIGAMILLLIKIGVKYPDIPEVQVLLDYFGKHLAARIQDLLCTKVLLDNKELGWRDGVLGTLWVALCCRAVNPTLCGDLIERVILEYHKQITDSIPFDSGMAGGLISAAHIINRIYHLTGNRTCREFARILYEKEIEAATFIDPSSGYNVWLTESDGFYGIHTGLLNGLAGIGLALMAAVSDNEPSWDECLMLS